METSPAPPPRPRISANLAVSADGKISDSTGRPSGWTSAADHQHLLDLRADADALMVGEATLLADRMTLACPGREIQPLRCVVSRRNAPPGEHPLFAKKAGPIHWLMTDPLAEVPDLVPPDTEIHRMNLGDFLQWLAHHSVSHLHCEGGGRLIRSLLEMDAIDELHLTIAGHTLFGGAASPTLTGLPECGFLTKSTRLELVGFRPDPESGECFVQYRKQSQ